MGMGKIVANARYRKNADTIVTARAIVTSESLSLGN